jgi:hypothetical protein
LDLRRERFAVDKESFCGMQVIKATFPELLESVTSEWGSNFRARGTYEGVMQLGLLKYMRSHKSRSWPGGLLALTLQFGSWQLLRLPRLYCTTGTMKLGAPIPPWLLVSTSHTEGLAACVEGLRLIKEGEKKAGNVGGDADQRKGDEEGENKRAKKNGEKDRQKGKAKEKGKRGRQKGKAKEKGKIGRQKGKANKKGKEKAKAEHEEVKVKGTKGIKDGLRWLLQK